MDDTIGQKSDEKLRIAWRYSQQAQQSQSPVETGHRSLQPNYFRTDKLLTKEEVHSQCSIASFKSSDSTERGSIYRKLAQDLATYIDNAGLNVLKTKSYTNISRIVLNSLGDFMYNDQCSLNEEHSTDLCKFLLYLR